MVLWSQDRENPLKIWNSVGVRASLTEDLHLYVNQLYGFNSAPLDLSFIQTSVRIQYRFGKHLNLSAGYLSSNSIRKDAPNKRKYRYFGTLSWRSKLDIWRISNGFKFEIHDPKETRYDYRFIYSFYIRPKSNLIAPKIKLTPFFNVQLYYNIGGKPITQYDDEGNKIGRFEPEGFHRVRLKSGFYLKPVKRIKLTFYGMYQKEFNTPRAIKSHRMINIENPVTGNISRPFQNYFVAGMSLRFYLSNSSKRKKVDTSDDIHEIFYH